MNSISVSEFTGLMHPNKLRLHLRLSDVSYDEGWQLQQGEHTHQRSKMVLRNEDRKLSQ